MAEYFLGADAKLFYKTTGIAGGGDFVEAENVRDVTIDTGNSEIDVTTRGSGKVKQVVQGLAEWTFEFQMIYDPSDAAFVAIRDANQNRTKIGIRALHEEDGTGPQADCVITKFKKGEPLDGVQMVDVTAKPTRSATIPGYFTS